MKPYFTLDNKNQDSTFIMIQMACEDSKLKYTSGKKCCPRDWDKLTQRTGVKATDKRLNDLESRLKDYVLKCEEAGVPILKDNARKYLEQKDGKIERNKLIKGSFFTIIDLLIEMAKSDDSDKKLLNDRTGKVYTSNTIRLWKSTRNILFEFDPELSFQTISIDTYNSFIGWCNDQDYSQNSTATFIRLMQTLSQISYKKELHKSLVHKDDRINDLSYVPYKISLMDEEIGLLIDYPLAGPDKEIRDRFVVNLSLGMRISDFKKIDETYIENDIIKMSNKKTGFNVAIPVSNDIKDILIEYDGKLPKQYGETHTNERIKIICKKAGIKGTERFVEKRGGKDVHVEKPRWKMVSSHTARRYVASNITKSGITIIEASNVLAMSIATLKRYDKTSVEQTAKNISQNAFFQKRRGSTK